ncbi:MAG TPA: polyketide cyclase [Acidimicrobiia bacterium]|jgi:uncharacterized protein YndB with AHSA1/START domain
MTDQTRQVVSGTVDAPPEAVFAVLANPSRHGEIDGSSMCQSSPTGPVTGVGQVFIMDMYRDGLGKYQTRNEVTAFEPGRRIAWIPNMETSSSEIDGLLGDITSGGQEWAFDLEPTGNGQTKVTHSYDWSTINDERFAAFCPFISPEEMSNTVSALGAAAARR